MNVLKDSQDILGKAQLSPADASPHLSHFLLWYKQQCAQKLHGLFVLAITNNFIHIHTCMSALMHAHTHAHKNKTGGLKHIVLALGSEGLKSSMGGAAFSLEALKEIQFPCFWSFEHIPEFMPLYPSSKTTLPGFNFFSLLH